MKVVIWVNKSKYFDKNNNKITNIIKQVIEKSLAFVLKYKIEKYTGGTKIE